MFLLTPFSALYSMDFYVQYIKKSFWKALLFVCYVTLLACFVITAVTTVKAPPIINGGITKVAEYMPDISLKDGEITVNNDTPVIIAPKELEGSKIVFDTSRTEPVYPTQMESEKITLLVTKKAVFSFNNGKMQVIEAPKSTEAKISRKIIEENKDYISAVVLYLFIFLQVLWQIIAMPIMIILFFLVSLLVNAANGSPLKAGQCLKTACYLCAPYLFLSLLNMISPYKIPLMSFVYLLMAGIYSIFITRAYIIGGIDGGLPVQNQNKNTASAAHGETKTQWEEPSSQEDNDPFEK